jgi:hypothetical protein
LRAIYAIAQIRSGLLADITREPASRAKPRLISAPRAHADIGTSIAFITCSQRRLRFAGLFWPHLAKTQGQAQPLIEEAWRSRRDARWLAHPCFRSDAVRKQDGE